MRVLVVSLVANPGAGVTDAPLTHQEVLDAGRDAAGRVRALLAALLADPRLYA
jgi:purine-nucleoside phosphorylase